MNPSPAPQHRSKLRLFFGKRWFRLRRYRQWILQKKTFATKLQDTPLPETIITHQSLILRPLAGVDMQLQVNKKRNLELAVQRINGLLIPPQKTFSFWYLVGNPSRRKGYLPGLVLQNGQIKQGVGGGLCQMGNLLFWMILHSPLTVTERWRHSYDVFPDAQRKVPFGSGATLSYNYVDLQFKNETSQTFQINLWLDQTHLHGALRCEFPLGEEYEVLEKNHQIRGQAWGGYTRHNQIIRRVKNKSDQMLVREELITENHAVLMYQPFLGAADGQIRSSSEKG